MFARIKIITMRKVYFLVLASSFGFISVGNVYSAQGQVIPVAEAGSAKKKVVEVYGLRSAKFGMTENEVRRAISVDFPEYADKTKKKIHPLEQTTILALPVNDFLHGSGEAVIAYVLGFKTKKLTQIDVIWRRENNQESTRELLALLFSLQEHFLDRKFPSEGKVANAALSNGGLLAFRGIDTKGRMVMVVGRGLTTTKEEGEEGEESKNRAQPPEVFLSYVESPKAPDVFRIKIEEGQL